MKQLCIAMLLLPFMVMAQTFEKGILTMNTITVKQGHAAQFTDGVKKWTECMKENGTTRNWNFWSRVQGEGSVYGLTGMMANWAEMDDESEDPAGAKCASTVSNFIMPHVEKVNRDMANTLPDWSKKTMATDTKLVWVTYFRVNNSTAFGEVIKEISGNLRATEGDARGQWYSFAGGGEESPDYMVVRSLSGYAELDVERDGPWKVYENVHGKKKTDDLRAKYRSAVDNSWAYLWSLNEKLSNQ